MRKFELTKDHVKLLNAAYVGWDSCEFGAPAIDCKYPYGDSMVVESIIKKLGWVTSKRQLQEIEDGDIPEKLMDRAYKVHEELKVALQVVLDAKSFQPGTYVNQEKHSDKGWKRLKK